MRRFRTGSALLALAVLTATAGAQPPKLPVPEPMPPRKVEPKKPDPTDVAIASALVNDPDVKMAQAKIQLAEAELAKARQSVTLKVLAAQSGVQSARSGVFAAEQELQATASALKADRVADPTNHPVFRAAVNKLEAVKGRLATAEAELRLLTAGHDSEAAKSVELGLRWLAAQQAIEGQRALILEAHLRAATAVKGPVPDRLRAALDKPVKLGPKGTVVTFAKAMEAFKEAGLDVPVRGTLVGVRPRLDAKGEMVLQPNGEPILVAAQITSEGETLPIGAWLQLFQDECGGTFYVREYGLLVVDRKSAPPDAPTLTEFWKQKPPAAKPEPAPEPKSK